MLYRRFIEIPLLFAAVACFFLDLCFAENSLYPRPRILSALAIESNSVDGGSSTYAIDIAQDSDCDENENSIDPEPFSNTMLFVKVVNYSPRPITFTSFSFRIGSGANSISSPPTALLDIGLLPTKSEAPSATMKALLLWARDGNKFAPGNTASFNLRGAQRVQFVLRGKDALGKRVRLKARILLAFNDYNRC